MRKNLDHVAEAILDSGSVALISHVNPDGDTIGSCLALKIGIEQLGKKCECFCQDKTPEMFDYLPQIGSYRQEGTGEKFDLCIAVDCASPDRLGSCLALLTGAKETAVVDHHGTNNGYCDINSVDGDASSTTLIIRELLKLLNVKMTPEIALCLYTGTSTDTGHFAYSCTTAEVFSLMEEAMQYDLPLSEVHHRLYRTRTRAQIALLEKMLSTMKFFHDGKYTITRFTNTDMEETGAMSEDTEGLINFGLDIKNVVITAMMKEQPDGKVKVGFRSFEPYHVDKIAASFGGGGHFCASGCTLKCALDEAEAKVKAEIEKEIDRVNV